jgi:hypothetical protein
MSAGYIPTSGISALENIGERRIGKRQQRGIPGSLLAGTRRFGRMFFFSG